MNKKGELTSETIVKMVITLLVLFFVLIIIWKSKDKIYSLIENFKDFLRFR